MLRASGIGWAICIAFIAAAGADELDAANLNAAKVDATPALSIQSWRPLPGEQFEVAGKMLVISAGEARRGESGARVRPGRGDLRGET